MFSVKKFFQGKKDHAVKIIAPKIVTGAANIVRLGPRMIFRSTVELLRANLFTRILSCVTLLGIDVYDLARGRISRVQFAKNLVLSAMLVISGTVGWNWGSRWIALEFLGGFVDIIGGIIGAGIMSFLSNLVLDKACDKIIETDAQKMWKILEPYVAALNASDQEEVRKKIGPSCLKKMYAAPNRQEFAKELVNSLHVENFP